MIIFSKNKNYYLSIWKVLLCHEKKTNKAKPSSSVSMRYKYILDCLQNFIGNLAHHFQGGHNFGRKINTGRLFKDFQLPFLDLFQQRFTTQESVLASYKN